ANDSDAVGGYCPLAKPGNRVARQTYRVQAVGTEGSQSRHDQQLRARQPPPRRADHLHTAAGMYGDVVDAERCGAAGGALDGLRDIVQLQIEEDRLAESANRFDRGSSMRDEQLEANLEQADVTQQPGSEPLRS